MIEKHHTFEAREDLAQTLARDVADELLRAIEAKGKAVLAVSGGTTPKLFFEALSKIGIPWPRVTVTLVDERQVPETSALSNARLVKDTLLKNQAASASFMPLTGSGAGDLPPFDVVVLGMGSDGHTASFFPGGDRLAEALDSGSESRLIEMRAPNASEPRLTFTLPVLQRAGRLKLHIEGAEKKKVLDRALGDGPAEDMPIRAILRGATPVTLYWSP